MSDKFNSRSYAAFHVKKTVGDEKGFKTQVDVFCALPPRWSRHACELLRAVGLV